MLKDVKSYGKRETSVHAFCERFSGIQVAQKPVLTVVKQDLFMVFISDLLPVPMA